MTKKGNEDDENSNNRERMKNQNEVSKAALYIFIIGIATFLASLAALPTLGFDVYLTIVYTSVVILIAALVEQLGHNRQKELMRRLDEIEKKVLSKSEPPK